MRPRLFAILVIAFIAYVLGARAGRERYDQLMGAVNSFWNEPNFKNARDTARKEAGKNRW
jgi:hypothetical protein